MTPRPPLSISLVPLLAVLALACSAPESPETEAPLGEPQTNPLGAESLLADVAVLAHDSMQGRAAGSEGGLRARAYVAQRFAELGLDPVGDSYLGPFSFEVDGEVIDGANVMGLIRGTELPDRFLVVTAHYDHVGVRDGEVFNGADDNASGVAALMALGTYLAERPLRHSVLLVATDAEERGMRGARALVSDPPVPLAAVVANVNLDMVSHADRELYVAGTHHSPALLPMVESVTPAPGVDLLIGHDTPEPNASDDWTLSSDHAAFHRADIPFLYFGVEDHPDYHRATDDVERLNPAFFEGAVETIRRVIVALDAANLSG